MVGTVGLEPTTYRLSDDCSTTELRPCGRGGEIRTPDTLFVGQVLSPLSYALWCACQDSNLGPVTYKVTALPLSYRRLVSAVGLEPTLTWF